jgi:CheY-like chemotaxis protein
VSPSRPRVRPSPNREKVVRPPLVLIVENDGDTRDMYAESFAFNGVRVVQSTTAADAMKNARTLCPDIIPTAIGLSGGADGCQLAEQLKADSRTKNIPVIAVTA